MRAFLDLRNDHIGSQHEFSLEARTINSQLSVIWLVSHYGEIARLWDTIVAEEYFVLVPDIHINERDISHEVIDILSDISIDAEVVQDQLGVVIELIRIDSCQVSYKAWLTQLIEI